MANRWFRIPETGTGKDEDAYRPKYLKSMGLSFSGNKTHPDGAPIWVVRVYGTADELDTLAGKNDVTEYSSVPTTALNQMFNQDRTDNEWNEAFTVTY